jgi:hypothetical protein
MFYEPDDIAKVPLQIISDTAERVDCCFDFRGLSILTQNQKLGSALDDLKKRGITLRFVIEITQENRSICKPIMKYGGEIFHDNRVKGNFMIFDGAKYLYYIIDNRQSKIVTQRLFYTSVRPFVDTQQYLFNSLCSKAIPAKDKIRELSKGIRGAFVESILDPFEIQKIAIDLLKSATYEILLLLPTTNSFYRLEDSGMLNLLEAAECRGVAIKILIQADNDMAAEKINEKVRHKNIPINIQFIMKPLQTRITTLVIDQSVSLAIENKEDEKKTIEAAAGVAIYSNSETTVSSCLSIFETLWIQSEFDKQNKIKQAYFQLFKGFKLKDEFYTRRWSPNKQKSNRKKD